ncbi:MAG TPA: prepilin-type N-terminal cleavage/methylation domain-containing protein [Candidatus Paceibacterota bacterium]|jgi:prepilin-type N-terminal cleavage/methylation domain-containing protein|nr:prepilin-type N-terminal cleavage/methylation domain-containing protein [Candidatus Paceibacterota bacterium]
MRKQLIAYSLQLIEKYKTHARSLQVTSYRLQTGFTLIETMVAISLLMLALIPPMSLAAQALTTAYYARNQVTAYYLAQEGIEIVRAVRDANIIAIAEGNSSANIFDGIPYGTTAATAPAFTVDALQVTSSALDTCTSSGCPPLQTNGSVYGYAPGCEPSGTNGTWTTSDCGTASGWTDTTFTRTVKAYLLSSSDPDEMRVTVSVTWKQGSFQTQTFTINEDLYRWVSG